MKKVSNELWDRLLGFSPAAELKEMILTSVKTEGITLEQACARHAFPGPLIILEDGKDTFEFEGRTYTPKTWEEQHPSRTLVIIH